MAGEVSPGGILLRRGKGCAQVEVKGESADEHFGTDVQRGSVTGGGRKERIGGGGGVA